ncbi:PepSY-associated TM helix domain-containing protein [Zeimonas arvi]|uniref:PepSY domain-containing protein n=1 Tax=Zeimonas arvi TaxID=2498847 RepID=A0A5C8NSS3_9BURK|nr:PepSY-associated TM helix domain-containing protein [Zeimonas arvi]TXL63905.1 PepSY domain-containing protein [Zeimonas arvi]
MPGEPASVPPSVARVRARRLWLAAHRWLGLAVGVVLFVSAVTGSAMLVADPLDEVLGDRLHRVAEPGPVDYRAVLARLAADIAQDASLTLRPPREKDESFQAMVRGEWSGTIFLHPSTGDVLGRRGETQGAMGLLFALHASLFAGEPGKAVLTLAAAGYLGMLASGVYLWWPSGWRQAWSIRLSGSGLRALFDLHRVTGALFGLLVMVSVATGAYMAWPPLAAAVTKLGMASPAGPPRVAGGPPSIEAVVLAVEHARTMFPDAMVGYVQVPAGADMPVRIRLRLPDDPHPNGLTSVWAHPDSAEIVQVNRWTDLDPGTRAYAYIYPLHSGELWGLPWTILVFASGVLLATGAVTGMLLWWRRRRPARPARTATRPG